MEKHEVVIVGAGPGGLKAAKTLEENGKEDILLLEALPKERIGDKFCGGWVTPRTKETIGIPSDLISHALREAIIHVGGLTATAHIKDFELLKSRIALGQYQLSLLEKTELRDNTKVADVNPEENYVTTTSEEQISYDYLIDGSGFKSSIQRRLLGKRENYWQVSGYITKTKGIIDNTLNLFVYPYFGSISLSWGLPLKDSFEVAVAYPIYGPVDKGKVKEHLEEIAGSKGLSLDEGEPKAAPVPWDYRGFRFGNIFLTGDAAGLPSTISGEGIYSAAKSGEIAAKAIAIKDYDWERELNKTVLKHYDWGPGAWLPKVNDITNLGLRVMDKIARKADVNIRIPSFIPYIVQNVMYSW